MRRSSAALSLALVVLVSVSVTWAVRVSEDPEDTNAVLDNKNAERAHEQPAQPPFHITPTPWNHASKSVPHFHKCHLKTGSYSITPSRVSNTLRLAHEGRATSVRVGAAIKAIGECFLAAEAEAVDGRSPLQIVHGLETLHELTPNFVGPVFKQALAWADDRKIAQRCMVGEKTRGTQEGIELLEKLTAQSGSTDVVDTVDRSEPEAAEVQ